MVLASVQKAGLCADHFNKDFINHTKLHLRRNPIPWIPKDIQNISIISVEDNDRNTAEEAGIIEENIQDVVDHLQINNRDCTPMDVDHTDNVVDHLQLDNQNCTPMEVDHTFEINIAETTRNNRNEEVVLTTNKKCYPSGKELFGNFGSELTDDEEWLNKENQCPLFVDNYFQEVEIKTKVHKKRKEKLQKRCTPQIIYCDQKIR
ncbi:unnamed protein product [Lasius platythorax]|uniref:THAP-type domain-containing protein n=1 Tax=Lasius platythorax TaxID=488582 RepID=A0AAV2MYG5_9HYME